MQDCLIPTTFHYYVLEALQTTLAHQHRSSAQLRAVANDSHDCVNEEWEDTGRVRVERSLTASEEPQPLIGFAIIRLDKTHITILFLLICFDEIFRTVLDGQ